MGRFLEHERVFVFGPSGDDEMFLSSADWMPRNLDRRVEVMFPVESETLREQIRREVIEPALADNARAYEMHADGSYLQRSPPAGEAPRNAQAIALERTVGQAPTPEGIPAPAPAPARRERPARPPRGEPVETSVAA